MTQKMTRLELEQFLEKIYLTRVIGITTPERKEIFGVLQRLSVDYLKGNQKELVVILMVDWKRYELSLPYFIEKAQIYGNPNGTNNTA